MVKDIEQNESLEYALTCGQFVHKQINMLRYQLDLKTNNDVLKYLLEFWEKHHDRE